MKREPVSVIHRCTSAARKTLACAQADLNCLSSSSKWLLEHLQYYSTLTSSMHMRSSWHDFFLPLYCYCCYLSASMIPLIEKDKLLLALVPLGILFVALWSSLPRFLQRREEEKKERTSSYMFWQFFCIVASHVLIMGTTALRYIYPNPLPHLPFLHDLINSVVSFAHFFSAFVAATIYMIRLPCYRQRTFLPPGGSKIKRG